MKPILQKQLAHKHKIKKQFKNVIVFPAKAVSELYSNGNQEVESTAQKSQLDVWTKKVKIIEGDYR